MINLVARLAVGAAVLFGIHALLKKKKVFVSYYYDADRHYKRLLTAWSANDKFELEFEDVSTDVSIDSNDEEYLKRVIAGEIKRCDVLLVLVGKRAHKRKWIAWEIAQARKGEKKIVAVKLRREYVSPEELLSAGATWVYGFNAEKIREAIEGD